MEANSEPVIPEPLWDDIFLAVGIDECYLRPISTLSKQFLSVSNRLKQSLHITTSNDHCLDRLLERFPNIKHINLPFFVDPARFFGEISRFNILLESLEMSLMKTFPIKMFERLPLERIRPTLKKLKLSYVETDADTDADADLEILAELFPNLEELELFWKYNVTHNGIVRVSSKLKRLRKVSISGNAKVTDDTVKALAQNCKYLEEIRFNQCRTVSSNGMTYAFCSCRNLKSVVLHEMVHLGQGSTIALARKLTSLEFSSMIVKDDLLRTISMASLPLTRLALSNCKKYTLNGVMLVLGAYHWQLEYFAIDNAFSNRQLRPVSVGRIAPYLWNAKTVKLNYCCVVSIRQLLGLIHSCSKLITLEVKGNRITQDQEAFFAQFNKKSMLRSLNLSFSVALSDVSLAMVSKACPFLSSLFINGCKAITQMGLGQIIRNCEGLKTIEMNGCDGVFGLGLEARVSGYKLEVLEARGSGLDDECLKWLALTSPDLRCLDVRNCRYVTGSGVREVAKRCKYLERLGVSFKNIDSDTEFFVRSKKPWLVNRYV